MIPFHRLYSLIFKSFDIHSETETIERMISEWVDRIMIIKRSWIFALAMLWIPLFILVISGMNITIASIYYTNDILRLSLIGGVGISVILFIFSVWSYITHFKKIYHTPTIRTDMKNLLEELKSGDSYFVRFFDQTILNQWIIIGLIVWGGYFYFTHSTNSWNYTILIDAGLLCIQWFLLGKYRKRMMDLEMDYNIVIPGKILFVNQSGMLSSSQAVEGEKVKTVSAKYPGWLSSFFQYGTIEIMTEGDSASMTGTMPMYYVTDPNETARLIQSLLERKLSTPTSRETENIPENDDASITSREHAYDTREKIRDVLR